MLKLNKKLKKKTLILIPARRGSSRVKNKNIRIIKNKPLIYWSIKFAKNNSNNADVVVSSDSNQINKICQKYKTRFLKRPKKYAGNTSSMISVIGNVLDTLYNENKVYKYVVLLQPTSPLREKNLIKKGLRLLETNSKYDVLYHLYQSNEFTGTLKKNREFIPDYDINTRSQDILGKYIPTGNLFIYRTSRFYQKNEYKKIKYIGFTSRNSLWVNIDFEKDFYLLDGILKKNPKVLDF